MEKKYSEINFDQLPLTIHFFTKDGIIKEYVLQTNNNKDKLLLCKKNNE